MADLLYFSLVLALVWGVLWALFLQMTTLGRFLVQQRTWITVVVGVGVDLGIAAICIPFSYWWRVAAIVALSSLGIISCSLYNEWREGERLKEALRDGS